MCHKKNLPLKEHGRCLNLKYYLQLFWLRKGKNDRSETLDGGSHPASDADCTCLSPRISLRVSVGEKLRTFPEACIIRVVKPGRGNKTSLFAARLTRPARKAVTVCRLKRGGGAQDRAAPPAPRAVRSGIEERITTSIVAKQRKQRCLRIL